jgi:uncharacterized membrane protein YqaE (UPF0057 family)
MSLGKRLLAIVLAIVLPPVGVWVASRNFILLGLCLVLFFGAQIMFWGMFALPGFALWILSILIAVVLALFPVQHGRSHIA